MNNETILITGNSGKTGSRVEQKLNSLGIATRGVSRSTAIAFDWNDPSTWTRALADMTTAYITFQPDLAVPGATDIMQAFISLAKSTGLKKIVLLSGRGEDGAQQAEQVVINSGLEWNIVRASWFAQNFSEGFMLEGILSGEMILPKATIPEPFIDVDDIADVAVAALTQTHLSNQVFEVTGPELMTFADCINAISAATGRAIQLKSVSVDEYINHLQAQGLPEEVLWLMRELFTEVFDGRNATVQQGVELALGRSASSFNDYINKTLVSGAWAIKKPIAQA